MADLAESGWIDKVDVFMLQFNQALFVLSLLSDRKLLHTDYLNLHELSSAEEALTLLDHLRIYNILAYRSS